MATGQPLSGGGLYYFDNNATTRVAPEVVAAMVPFLSEHWGKPLQRLLIRQPRRQMAHGEEQNRRVQA